MCMCHRRSPLSQFGCLVCEFSWKCPVEMTWWIHVFTWLHSVPQNAAKRGMGKMAASCQILVTCFDSCICFSLWPQFLTCFLSWQVYLINVTYSDNTSHIIYRRYSKFFDLQVIIHHSQAPLVLTVQVGFLLKSFPCFPLMHSEPVNRHDCLYRLICKPCDFSLQLCLRSTPWHLYESVCGLVIDRGAGETWLVSVSCVDLQQYAISPALCGVSVSLLFLFSDLAFSSLSSSPPYLRHVGEPTGLFMVQAKKKTKTEIDIMHWALWQFLNVTPTWRTLFFSGGGRFYEWTRGLLWKNCTVPLPERLLYDLHLCVTHVALGPPACCKLAPYV